MKKGYGSSDEKVKANLPSKKGKKVVKKGYQFGKKADPMKEKKEK